MRAGQVQALLLVLHLSVFFGRGSRLGHRGGLVSEVVEETYIGIEP